MYGGHAWAGILRKRVAGLKKFCYIRSVGGEARSVGLEAWAGQRVLNLKSQASRRPFP